MLKRFRKMITNRVPGEFEKNCFSDEEIFSKLKSACCTKAINVSKIIWSLCYTVTVKKINYSKTVHGYNDFSKKVVHHYLCYN